MKSYAKECNYNRKADLKMSNDESNFDTMRLIEGATGSELYSLEDIVQEFSSDETAEAEKEHDLVSPEKSKKESTEIPIQENEEEPEIPVEEAGEESIPSAYHNQSESEIADEIAQAVAASFPVPAASDKGDVAADSEKSEDQTQQQRPGQKSELHKEVKPKTVPAKERTSVTEATERNTDSSIETKSQDTPKSTGNKAVAASVPNVQTVKDKTEVEITPPGAKQKKIPKSSIRVSSFELVGMMLGDLRDRQRQDLPRKNASLKSAEKHYSLISRICRLFSPIRYIILLLMVFSLAGRTYSWMLLGFLGGNVGVLVTLALSFVALLASWHSVFRALKDILYLRFSYESLLLITTILSMAEAAIYQNTETLLPLLVIGWCLAETADLMVTKGKLRSLRTIIGGKTRMGVRIAKDKWEHTDCIGKAPTSTSGFVRRQEESDTFHSGWSAYAILLFIIALVVSAYLTAKVSGNYLTILVTILTVACPVSCVLCCARPYELLTRILGSSGAVAGWLGMKVLSGKKAILIYDRDLFPKGTITHKGVKVYGNQTPELLISYGASLVLRADNGLNEPFTRLLKETGGQVYHVSYFQVLEGGLIGQINGVLVAVGTYNFMQLMGIMPPKNGSKSGLFIALNGEIAGLFAIKYRVRSGAISGFQRLVKEQRLVPLIATKNLCVNPAFIENYFQVPVEQVVCPKVETRRSLSEPSLMVRGITSGYITKDGILPYSRFVAGARRCYRAGLIFTILSILESLAMLVYTIIRISSGKSLASGVFLLAIQLLLLILIELAARISVK